MKKGVIFDFDGVIVDTEFEKFRIIKNILKEYNYELKQREFSEFIGKKTGFFLKEKFSEMPRDVLDKVILCRRAEQYKNPKKNKLIPGIKELLVFLKLYGYEVTIVTGSSLDFVKKVLDFNNLSKQVDTIVSGDDFSNSKPNPECFKLALKKLGLSNKEVLIVEDSIPGIKAAKHVGCKVFALSTYLSKDKLAEADNVFKDNFELLEYFKEKDL